MVPWEAAYSPTCENEDTALLFPCHLDCACDYADISSPPPNEQSQANAQYSLISEAAHEALKRNTKLSFPLPCGRMQSTGRGELLPLQLPGGNEMYWAGRDHLEAISATRRDFLGDGSLKTGKS